MVGVSCCPGAVVALMAAGPVGERTVRPARSSHNVTQAAKRGRNARRSGRYLGEQWDIPGESVDRGESPAEAAVRECAEETGLAAHVAAELAHYSNLDTEGRDIVFHTLTYELRAAWTGDHVPRVELAEVEHDDHAWLTVREALDLPLVWHVRDTLEAVASC